MRRIISLLIPLLIFTSLGLSAQKIEQMWNNAQSIAQSKPQDAIRAYDELMLKAEQEKRYDILLNAGVERRMVTVNWAPDSLLPYAERLKKREAFVRRNEPVLSSIYCTLLCALGQSDSPDGQAYAQLALAHPELLAHTRVKTKGNTIDKYFHYDLLHIIGYTLGDFSTLNSYYSRVGNRPATFFIALERLKQNAPTDKASLLKSNYLHQLDSLAQAYHDIKEGAEASILFCQLQREYGLVNDSILLANVERAICQWTSYPRVNILRQMVSDMTRSSLSLSQERSLWSTDEEISLTLAYKNVNNVKVIVRKIKEKNLNWEDNDIDDMLENETIHSRKCFSQTYNLTNTNRLRQYRDKIKLPKLKAGMYLLELKTDPKTIGDRTMFFVSDIRLMSHPQAGDTLRLAIVRAKDSQPIRNASIQLDKGKPIAVNDQGELRLYDYEDSTSLYVITPEGAHLPPIDVDELSDYNLDKADTTRMNIFLDRGVYRPGQIVHVGVIRHQINHTKTKAWSNALTKLYLRNPQGEIIDSVSIFTDDYGTAHTSFTLPNKTLNGSYTIGVGWNVAYFRVEEYKRPTFTIEISKPTMGYALGDSIMLEGKAQNLMGEPVRRARVVINRTYLSDTKPDTLFTDNRGQFLIPMKLDRSVRTGVSRNFFSINGTLTDGTGEQETFNYTVYADDKRAHLTIQSDGDYRVELHHLPQLCFLLTNRCGVLQKGRVKYWLKGYESDVQSCETSDTYTLKPSDKSDNHSVGVITLPLPANVKKGRNELIATCEGDTARYSFILFDENDKRPCEGMNGWFYTTGSDFGEDDNSSVKVYFGTTKRNIHVLYSIFTPEKTLENGTLELSDTIVNRTFTYRPEYGDGMTICYAYYVDGQFLSFYQTINRRLDDKNLNLSWTTFRDRLVPGDKETWRLKVSTPDGHPVRAQLMATLYDRALDRIAENQWKFSLGDRLTEVRAEWLGMDKLLSYYMSTYSHSPSITYDYPSLDMGLAGGAKIIVEGKVVGEDGEPIIGATVMSCERSGLGTVTDIDGHYRLKVHYGETLQFSYIGMQSVVRKVYGSRLDMTMKENSDQLQEVVVRGYSSVKKESLTGSVTIVKNIPSLYGSRAPIYPIYIPEEKTSPTLTLSSEELQHLTNLPIRKNFTELAFFYPNLMSDTEGNVTLNFTLPESVTSWQFMGLAHTQDMKYGLIRSSILARKHLMVQTNLPRFIRIGDKVSMSAKIFNVSDKNIDGKATLLLLNAENEKVIYSETQAFQLKSDSTQVVSFSYTPAMNNTPSLLVCKVIVTDGKMSDGEQHYLPVLDNKELITQAIPFTLVGNEKLTFHPHQLFPTNSEHKGIYPCLRVEYTKHPETMIIDALHAYTHPVDGCAICQAMAYYTTRLGHELAKAHPNLFEVRDSVERKHLTSNLEKNEELKSLSLQETPWTLTAKKETEQKLALVDFLNESKLSEYEKDLTERLRELQQSDGSWAWFKGMLGNRWVTETVMELLVRLNAMIGHQRAIDEMMEKGFHYLGQGKTDLEELYLRALDGRGAKETLTKHSKKLIRSLKKNVSTYDIYSLAQSAILLYHYGEQKEARQLVETLKQYTVYDQLKGRYYDSQRAGYSWLDYKIPSHVSALEALQMITPEDRLTIAQMKQWLLQEKRTQYWLTTINSANAIYAFLNGKSLTDAPTFRDTETHIFSADKLNGIRDISLSGEGRLWLNDKYNGTELASDSQSVSPTHISFGALYFQSIQSVKDIKAPKGELQVKREIIPLQAGALQVGSHVKVRITLTSTRDLDFVQIIDNRAACMEPVDKTSGYRYGRDCSYYLDVKDNCTNLFIGMLPKGVHVIEQEYYLDRSGTYTTGTITAQCAYAPEYISTEKGLQFSVLSPSHTPLQARGRRENPSTGTR